MAIAGQGPAHPYPLTTVSLIIWILLPLLLVVAVVDILTMSPARRAQMLRRAGMAQVAIAARLGCSRYRVRQYLAA